MHVLAVLFGVGAALTLDEFALWLRLDDVYWTREGRRSVDAVLVALVVGCPLLLGANPFDADEAAGEGVIALTVAANLLFALVTILKGRGVPGVVGVSVAPRGAGRHAPAGPPAVAVGPALVPPGPTAGAPVVRPVPTRPPQPVGRPRRPPQHRPRARET